MLSRSRKRALFCCAAMLTGLAPVAPAIAQQAPAAEASPIAGEIIVTARKRQESILQVPVIETVVAQEQLERLQTQDLKDVAKLVPGLALGDSVLAIGTQVSLRGVGTTTLDPGVDQSVALNLDGLQLSQGLAYSSGMFDVQQVEVLKGPQALFYGKNSPGGVISLRTADPGPAFEVMARIGRELIAEQTRTELIVSGPVTDTLGLRLATAYDTSEGYFRNTAVPAPGTGARAPEHRSNPPTESYIVRGTAVWRPTGRFDARLKLNWVRDEITEAGALQLVSCPDGITSPGPIPFLAPTEDCRKNRYVNVVNMDPAAFPGLRKGATPYTLNNQQFGTLELNYRLRPELTLTSTTGYYRIASDTLINGSASGFAGPPYAAENYYRRQDVTQELRLTSDYKAPLNYTFGAFYQDASVRYDSMLPGNVLFGLPAQVSASRHEMDIEAISAFGQLRWSVTPSLEVAAGARWAHEKRSDNPASLLGPTPVPIPLAVPEIESDNISPELTISYRPTDTLTLFGSLKRGYKSGSFTISRPATPGGDSSFGDEKVEGGEIGLKSRLFDRRLALNLAAYDYRYTGLQVGANEPAQNGVPLVRTLNAGSAKIRGVELDAAYRPEWLSGLGLNLSAAWNEARFKTLDNVPCWGGQTIAEGCDQFLDPRTGLFTSQNLAGEPLVRAPDWQVNFGFDYEVEIGHGLTLAVANNNLYSSKYKTNLGLRSDFYQPSFIKTDLSVALRGPDDRWEFALIGKNLTDELTTGNCINSNAANGTVLGGVVSGGAPRGPAGSDELLCLVDRGREVWLRLTVRPVLGR